MHFLYVGITSIDKNEDPLHGEGCLSGSWQHNSLKALLVTTEVFQKVQKTKL